MGALSKLWPDLIGYEELKWPLLMSKTAARVSAKRDETPSYPMTLCNSNQRGMVGGPLYAHKDMKDRRCQTHKITND